MTSYWYQLVYVKITLTPTYDNKNEIYHIFTQTETPRWNKTDDTATVIVFNVCDSKPLKSIV